MNRTLEATARPEDVPWLWRQYAFRGYLLLQRVDVALLEGRLPPAVFYNLMIAGASRVSERSAPVTSRRADPCRGSGSSRSATASRSARASMTLGVHAAVVGAVAGARARPAVHLLRRQRRGRRRRARAAAAARARRLRRRCAVRGRQRRAQPAFDSDAYERDLDAIAAGLRRAPSRLLMLTHAARPRPADVRAQAADGQRDRAARGRATHGAVVADLGDFGGWTLRPARRRPPDAARPARDRRPRGARARRAGPAVVARRDRAQPGPRYAAGYARMTAAHMARRVRERAAQRIEEQRLRKRAKGPPGP